MSCHFSANQFDEPFRPNRLGNWEIPKYYPRYPEARKHSTKVIANDRGHLKPGVPKTGSPWGDYKSTWELPKRITKEVAKELSSPPTGGSRWKQQSKSDRRPQPGEESSRQEADSQSIRSVRSNRKPQSEEKNQTTSHHQTATHHQEIPDHPGTPHLQETDPRLLDHTVQVQAPNNQQELDLEYIPGDLTSPRHRHESRKILLKQKRNKKLGREPELKLNDLYLEEHECHDLVAQLNEHEKKRREVVPHVLGEDVDDNYEEMRKNYYRQVTEKPNEGGPPSPLVPAYCNFQMARKMAVENLEHQPLPDAVADKAYRRLQAQGILNPGLALDVIPYVTGIGVKNHKAGPTQCTKLRVFRPKTSGIVPKPLDKSRLTNRPQTSFERKDNMGAMDLAICWDYRPVNPNDEPKPPTHIDGSNGSAAPAVFTVVKTPRSSARLETGRSGGVFASTMGEGSFFDRDVVRQHQLHQKKHSMERVCSCGNSAKSVHSGKNAEAAVELYRSRDTARTKNDSSGRQKRCKSSPNLSELAHSSTESYKENAQKCFHDENNRCLTAKPEKKRHRHHHHHHRRYSAERVRPDNVLPPPNAYVIEDNKQLKRLCQQPNLQSIEKDVQKEPYKIAFKAGIPNSNSSGTCTSFDSGCSSMTTTQSSSTVTVPKIMNVPKPRHPYAKKNYNIDTLVPPFACWRGGAGQGGYPEHWRLASVYQHAYKPIDQRKRPLLATVYQ